MLINFERYIATVFDDSLSIEARIRALRILINELQKQIDEINALDLSTVQAWLQPIIKELVTTYINDSLGDIGGVDINSLIQEAVDTAVEQAIDTINNNINTINTSMQQLANRVTVLENTANDNVQSQIDAINVQITTIQGQIGTINTTISGINVDISELRVTIGNTTQTAFQALTQANTNLSTINQMNATIANINDTLSNFILQNQIFAHNLGTLGLNMNSSISTVYQALPQSSWFLQSIWNSESSGTAMGNSIPSLNSNGVNTQNVVLIMYKPFGAGANVQGGYIEVRPINNANNNIFYARWNTTLQPWSVLSPTVIPVQPADASITVNNTLYDRYGNALATPSTQDEPINS